MPNYNVHPIGHIKAHQGEFTLVIAPEYRAGLQALEGFSHLEIIWWFDKSDTTAARKVIQAPAPYKRAPEIVGIFATRSPVRPNPIALSVAQVFSIDPDTGLIRLAYLDADDNSPILDIKPYTPSLDRVENPQTPNWCAHWPRNVETSGNFPWENEFNF